MDNERLRRKEGYGLRWTIRLRRCARAAFGGQGYKGRSSFGGQVLRKGKHKAVISIGEPVFSEQREMKKAGETEVNPAGKGVCDLTKRIGRAFLRDEGSET